MYYTLEGNRTMKRTLSSIFGSLLVFALVACGSGGIPAASTQATPVSAPTSPPATSKHVAPASLPQICNCVLRFDHISIEHGLSQSSVQVIFQDRRGFLWFGTQDGLNRYDGYNFKIYKPDPDASNSLSDRWIPSIVEDRDGYLWIGTRLGGLNRYDPRTEQFAHFTHDDTNPLSISDNLVNVLYIDAAENLWMGTPSGLDQFDQENSNFQHQR